jgi:hypothetical protein
VLGFLTTLLLALCSAQTSPTLELLRSAAPDAAIPVAAYASASAKIWTPRLSEPRWVVPSAGLPSDLKVYPSNNNVGIVRHDGRLYMAWRSSPNHFASDKTVMNVVSSSDEGKTWRTELVIALGTDLREPTLVSFKGALSLYYVKLGKNALKFEPQGVWRRERAADGTWGEPLEILERGELAWEIKERDGRLWLTSYKGNHYGMGKSEIEVYFKVSDDGIHWTLAPGGGAVYRGGVSEASFEFDPDGNLWAVTRNEDGDNSGWGSHVAVAPAGRPGEWAFPDKSDPERYDSPRMFRHEGEIYLVARRDVGGPFGQGWKWLPRKARSVALLLEYWRRPKRTALYRVDRASKKVVHLLDFPSAGDTAFPSIVRTGEHTFTIANYTSPPKNGKWAWLRGQISSQGTQIYLIDVDFN